MNAHKNPPGDFTPTIPPPDPNTKTPKFKLPPKSTDAHCHIFGPGDKYPFAPDRRAQLRAQQHRESSLATAAARDTHLCGCRSPSVAFRIEVDMPSGLKSLPFRRRYPQETALLIIRLNSVPSGT